MLVFPSLIYWTIGKWGFYICSLLIGYEVPKAAH